MDAVPSCSSSGEPLPGFFLPQMPSPRNPQQQEAFLPGPAPRPLARGPSRGPKGLQGPLPGAGVSQTTTDPSRFRPTPVEAKELAVSQSEGPFGAAVVPSSVFRIHTFAINTFPVLLWSFGKGPCPSGVRTQGPESFGLEPLNCNYPHH